MPTVDEAVEELAPLQRTKDYPKDSRGMLALAQGLIRAGDIMGVTMAEIVRRCADTSPYCPTDSDLLNVARDVREEHRRRTAVDPVSKWREQCGPAKPFDINGYDHERVRRHNAEIDELWRAAKTALAITNGNWPPESVICAALRKAGYPKTAHQREVMHRWENPRRYL